MSELSLFSVMQDNATKKFVSCFIRSVPAGDPGPTEPIVRREAVTTYYLYAPTMLEALTEAVRLSNGTV